MPHAITHHCNQCGDCLPQCPRNAIKTEGTQLWIDPTLCDDCKGVALQPQCVVKCPIESPPLPLQAKKGRCKTASPILTNPTLFSNSKSHPFASAIVVWEACNILAQRHSLSWTTDAAGNLCYERQVSSGRGAIAFRVISQPYPTATVLDATTAQAELAGWDIRAACLHLIYAAHVTQLEQPWEQEFSISDRQIESYLGLEKRKDLSKLAKLTLIKTLAEQPCKLQVDIHWFQQGKVQGFSLQQSHLWHLLDIQHHFQEDDLGCKHLTGLTFSIRAGAWAKYFLDLQAARAGTAFYQYSSLPKSLLWSVTSLWQQHEGASRLLLWLLFKTKMGSEQRLTVPTLMRVAYGESRLEQANVQREERKRLLRAFESDLEVLNHYGLKPVFDSLSYPVEIQPLWAKLADLPDDAEAALEFWTQDGSSDHRLTDAAPRDKWNRLLHARLHFELPEGWNNSSTQTTQKKVQKDSRSSKRKDQSPRRSRRSHSTRPSHTSVSLSGEQIVSARKRLNWSQRDLATQVGKSQSWVRDVENGRLQVSFKDQQRLLKILEVKL